MAWSWSYSPDGHGRIVDLIHEETPSHLAAALAEYECYDPDGELDVLKWDKRFWELASWTDDALADAVIDAAFEIQTSDNGGSNPWYCPYGCHTLESF